MIRKALIVLVSLVALNMASQSFSGHQVALTPAVFPKVQPDETEFINKILARLPFEDRNLVHEYAANAFYSHERFLNSNEAYTNWPEATEYVKRVLKRAIPRLSNNEGISVCIIRSPDFNAFCMENGNILISTGFLAVMNNEAELAATLCHEYGHYFCNHNFKGFEEKKESEKRGSSFLFQRPGNYYSYLRNAERTADTFAFHFFRTNGYSPLGIVSNFKNSNKIIQKYQTLRGSAKASSYYSTHPPSEERIEAAMQFMKETKISRKLFQEDSLEFERVKARAADECIYLMYEELRFDECLEMAFLQHLFHPDDEFYLYFIVQSLRSKMASEKHYGEYPFITSFYNPGKLKSPKFDPVCRDAKSGIYLHSKYFRMSVFNQLQGPIFSLSAEQLQLLKMRNCLDRDTIDFFTNRQALDHFLEILPESSVFNSIRMKYGLPVKEPCGGTKYRGELEKDLGDIYAQHKNYAGRDCMNKGIVVLHQADFYEANHRSMKNIYDPQRQKNIFHDYSVYAGNHKFRNIIGGEVLNFRERSKIKDITDFIESLPEENFSGKYNIDFLEVCPELVMQAAKNNAGAIFIVKLDLYPVNGSRAVIYEVDIRNKHIGKTEIPLGCSYTAPPEKIFGKIFGACENIMGN